MQIARLPSNLNIKYEANKRSDFKGVYPKDVLTKLSSFVGEIIDDIKVTFSCKYDILGYPIMEGEVSVKVKLTCMRCYEDYNETINTSFIFTPVKDIFDVPEDLDNYITLQFDQHGECNILDAIEDELICAIPINPKEPVEQCKFGSEMTFGESGIGITSGDNAQMDKPKNPFAELLKK